MTARKIFWIVLTITLIVWGGVGIYYFLSGKTTPVQKEPQSFVPTGEISLQLKPPYLETNGYLVVREPLAFKSFSVDLTFEGEIKSIDGNRFILTKKLSNGQETGFIFEVNQETDLYNASQATASASQALALDDFKVGDRVEVTGKRYLTPESLMPQATIITNLTETASGAETSDQEFNFQITGVRRLVSE